MSIAGQEPQPEDEVIRARQKARARITAWLLAAFIILLFFITIAKMGLHR